MEAREVLARSLYAIDPLMDQDVDLDNRPVREAGAVRWDRLIEYGEDGEAWMRGLYEQADTLIAALDAAGFALTPPNHVQFPRSREEAEAMNAISERFLKDNPFPSVRGARE